MAKKNLPKLTVDYNEKKKKWELTDDKTNKVIKSTDTKEKMTEGGKLEKALGKEGGSVKIQKKDGKFQEERTFPGSKDPKNSKG